MFVDFRFLSTGFQKRHKVVLHFRFAAGCSFQLRRVIRRGEFFPTRSYWTNQLHALLQLEKNRKYAKWKAAYIHNCLKSGETPIPGPVGGDEAPEFPGERYFYVQSKSCLTLVFIDLFTNLQKRIKRDLPICLQYPNSRLHQHRLLLLHLENRLHLVILLFMESVKYFMWIIKVMPVFAVHKPVAEPSAIPAAATATSHWEAPPNRGLPTEHRCRSSECFQVFFRFRWCGIECEGLRTGDKVLQVRHQRHAVRGRQHSHR